MRAVLPVLLALGLCAWGARAAPPLAVSPADQEVNELDSPTFSVAAPPAGFAYTYLWHLTGAPLAVGQVPTALARLLVLPEVRPALAGTYTCNVTRSDGARLPATSAVLRVRYRPVLTLQPAPRTALAPGAPFTLTVAAHGFPAPAFRWERDGEPVPGATAATLVLPAVEVFL